MMMKGFSVLLLGLCCGLSEAQNKEKDLLTSVTQEDRLAVLERRLEASENEVSQLKNRSLGQYAIAFSVALLDEASPSGIHGPFPQRTVITYKKVFTNAGYGYNPQTGTFTTAVQGMYFFRSTMFTTSVPEAHACIWKNNEILVCMWNVKTSSGFEGTSNGVVVPLVAGDRVNVRLEATRKLYDNHGHYNTFSGFLLFPF